MSFMRFTLGTRHSTSEHSQAPNSLHSQGSWPAQATMSHQPREAFTGLPTDLDHLHLALPRHQQPNPAPWHDTVAQYEAAAAMLRNLHFERTQRAAGHARAGSI